MSDDSVPLEFLFGKPPALPERRKDEEYDNLYEDEVESYYNDYDDSVSFPEAEISQSSLPTYKHHNTDTYDKRLFNTTHGFLRPRSFLSVDASRSTTYSTKVKASFIESQRQQSRIKRQHYNSYSKQMKSTLQQQQLRSKSTLSKGYDLTTQQHQAPVVNKKTTAHLKSSDNKFEIEKMRRALEEEQSLLERKQYCAKAKAAAKSVPRTIKPSTSTKAVKSPIYVLEQPSRNSVKQVKPPAAVSFSLNRPATQFFGGGFKKIR